MSLKEENLITYNGTLKKGQRLVKAGNSFIPVGVGGAFEPSGSGSGDTSAFESEMTAIIGEDANIPPVLVSGMKFYKCASVDTTSKMWTGYELILTDGVYSVSETLTEGLCYSAVKPVIGSVYSQDALIKVDMFYSGTPTEGLVLYEPLSTDIGAFSVRSGTPVFTVVDGVSCMQVKASVCCLNADSSNLPAGSSSRSVSCWIYINSGATNWQFYMTYGSPRSNGVTTLGLYQNYFTDYYTGHGHLGIEATKERWCHICLVYDGTNVVYYVDGVPMGVFARNYNTVVGVNYPLTIAGMSEVGGEASYSADGYMTGLRIYNRALTQDEIAVLANEFTPTTA